MSQLDLSDLIGIRYALHGTDRRTGVDCLWTVRQVAPRVFPSFEPWELPVTEDECAAAIAAAREGRSLWREVGKAWFQADRLGDLLRGESDEHAWCAIVVDPVGRIACTAIKDHGVCRRPIRALSGLTGVYRRMIQ